MKHLLILFLICCAVVGAEERTRLMYLESDKELKAAIALKRLKLNGPIYRLGIAKAGDRHFALVRFGVKELDRRQISRDGMRICRELFKMFPELSEVDLHGVDQAETKKRKPETLFTANVTRLLLGRVSHVDPPRRQLEGTGELYFHESLAPAPPSRKLLERSVVQALRGGWPKPKPKKKPKR